MAQAGTRYPPEGPVLVGPASLHFPLVKVDLLLLLLEFQFFLWFPFLSAIFIFASFPQPHAGALPSCSVHTDIHVHAHTQA